jgi:hypothetical protein
LFFGRIPSLISGVGIWVDVESEHPKGTSQSRRVEKGTGLDREYIIMIGGHYCQAEQNVDAGSKRAKSFLTSCPIMGCHLAVVG